MPNEFPRIQPRYWSTEANAPIELGSAPVRLSAGALSATGIGTARLEMAPRDMLAVSVELDGSGDDIAISGVDQDDLILQFGESGRPANMLCVRSGYSDASSVQMKLVVKSGSFTLCRDKRKRLDHIVVHILNFPTFFTTGQASTDFVYEDGKGTRRRLGRIVLQSAGWRIEIQEQPETKQLVEQLKSDGGNAITHVARIRKADNRTFSIRDGELIVRRLQEMLSFARGQWTALFGATGYSRAGGVIYEQWANSFSTPWKSAWGWFDVHHAECLAQLFDGFLAARTDPSIGKDFHAGLYWYLRSNRGGEGAGVDVDGSLILSQAALEGLAVGCLRAAGLTTNGRAAEKIRRFCQHLKIPTSIPKELRYLRYGKRKSAWDDGPHAITEVRNDLVHPARRSAVNTHPAIGEAWQLAQWYLELAILRLSGYSGVYSNRLSSHYVGEVQPVPWARTRRK